MSVWPSRVLDLLGIELPIVQAPMAGAADGELVAAVSAAGGLGSLACALLGAEQVRTEVAEIRQKTSRPYQLNFFCHRTPPADEERETRWRRRLDAYYVELGIRADSPAPPGRAAFDEETCALVEELRPPVVSFHFGLP